MYNAAIIILWIAIILTVLEIIAKIFVQNQDENQNQENKEDNTTEKKE